MMTHKGADNKPDLSEVGSEQSGRDTAMNHPDCATSGSSSSATPVDEKATDTAETSVAETKKERPKAATREERLAEALRANLRRRKNT